VFSLKVGKKISCDIWQTGVRRWRNADIAAVCGEISKDAIGKILNFLVAHTLGIIINYF
jgi:hypothetical protein